MKKKIFILLTILTSVLLVTTKVEAKSYNYDYFGQVTSAPDSYVVDRQIKAGDFGLNTFRRLKDVKYHNNLIYILDEDIGVMIIDKDYNLVETIYTFNNGEEMDNIKGSTSISVTEDYIFVADKESHRLTIFNNNEQYNFYRYIYLPENIPGMEGIVFNPDKIEVDHTGRIFVVADDVFEGIMEFDIDGDFKQYVGTNKIKVNFWDYFWQQLVSKEGQGSFQLYLPVVFTSLAIDQYGFLYTTSESADINPIQKFNYKGEDVLIQNGNIPVTGDIFQDEEEIDPSAFVDIDVNEFGIYLALEKNRRRVFAYNDNGELLYIFGGEGNKENSFNFPVALHWLDEKVIVLDRGSRTINILKPSEYATAINNAVKHYYEGDMDKSMEFWEKVLVLNSNLDLPYVGIGKTYYQREEYKEALDYFKKGHNKVYYSKAYGKHRNEVFRDNFTWISVTLIGLIVVVQVIKRRRKKDV